MLQEVSQLVNSTDTIANASEATVRGFEKSVEIQSGRGQTSSYTVVDEDSRPPLDSMSEIWSYWWNGVALECDASGFIGKLTIF